jgi:nucleoside-diphosphate-sugar epimerase
VTNNEGGLQVVIGTGPLGLAVARQLVSSGKQVRMVNRSGRADAPERVEVVAGDAGDPVAARSLCQEAAVVFHCASGPYARWPEALPPLMAGIIEGAAGAGARLVYGDNLYMYGRPPGPLTEDMPYRPVGPNTRVRAQVATTLMNAHASGKLRAAIGRASDFYGPHARQSIVGDGVFARALGGRPAQVLGNPDVLHTYTFIDDFARGLITLSEHEEAVGRVWHVPSAEPVTTRRLAEMVFEQVGTPARVRRVPKLAIKVLALFNPMMRAVSEVLYQSEYRFVVDHSRFAQAFGSHPTPHQEAIADTVAWFRQHATTAPD